MAKTQDIRVKLSETIATGTDAENFALNVLTSGAHGPILREIMGVRTMVKDSQGNYTKSIGGVIGAIIAVGTGTDEQGNACYQTLANLEDVIELSSRIDIYDDFVSLVRDTNTGDLIHLEILSPLFIAKEGRMDKLLIGYTEDNGSGALLQVGGNISATENIFTNLRVPQAIPTNPTSDEYYFYVGEIGTGATTPDVSGSGTLVQLTEHIQANNIQNYGVLNIQNYTEDVPSGEYSVSLSGHRHTVADIHDIAVNYLKLSGGTISGRLYKRTTGLNYITFEDSDGSTYGHLGFHGANKPMYMPKEENVVYTLIHSGNVEDYTLTEYNIPSKDENPTVNHYGLWQGIGAYFSIGFNSDYKLDFRSNSGALQASFGVGVIDWKTIAFTDSNVASATKLKDNTAYTVWGKTFFENGKPVSVTGDLTFNNNTAMYFKDSGGEKRVLIYYNSANSFYIGRDNALDGGGNTYISGHNVSLVYSGGITGATLNSSGNFLIGTTTDSGSGAKLQIYGGIQNRAGSSYFSGYGTYSATSLTELDSVTVIGAGKDSWGIYMWAKGNGDGAVQVSNSDDTLRYDLLLQPFGGNVIIGTTIQNRTGAKLQVTGNISSNGNLVAHAGNIMEVMGYTPPSGDDLGHRFIMDIISSELIESTDFYGVTAEFDETITAKENIFTNLRVPKVVPESPTAEEYYFYVADIGSGAATPEEVYQYSITQIDDTTSLGANIREAYQLVKANGEVVGDTIKIYKDSALQSVTAENGVIKFNYLTTSGDSSTIELPLKDLITETIAGNGISIDANTNILSVDIADGDANPYLGFNENGALYLKGGIMMAGDGLIEVTNESGVVTALRHAYLAGNNEATVDTTDVKVGQIITGVTRDRFGHIKRITTKNLSEVFKADTSLGDNDYAVTVTVGEDGTVRFKVTIDEIDGGTF